MTAVVALAMGIIGAGGHLSLTLWARVLFSALLLVGMAYAADLSNMVADGLREDRVHPTKKNRPIPSGEVSTERVLSNATSIFLVEAILAVYLFTPAYAIALLLVGLTAYIYSMPPRTKNGLVLNGVGISLPRSIFGPMAAFLAGSGGVLNGNFWAVLVISVPLVALAGEIRNLEPDASADRAYGVRTISNTYGDNAGWFVCILGLGITPLLAAFFGLTSANPLLWILMIPPLLMFAARYKGWSRHTTHQIYHFSFMFGILAYAAPWLIKAAGL
jgi:4-hydroxybenzoate polyprenyltransferase